MDPRDRLAAAGLPVPPPPRRPPFGAQARPTRYGVRTTTTGGAIKSITPSSIGAAIAQADRGDPRRLAEMLQEMEDRDSHITSIIGTRKRSVANLAWTIRPASEEARDRDIAAACTEMIRQMVGLRPAMLDLLGGILTGFAATEIQWKIEAGRVLPVRLDHRPPRWFRPDPDEPDCWRVLDAADPVWGVPLTPDKWIVHTPRAKSGFPTQAGLGRPALWLYCFKRYGVADWVTYNERHGNPTRVGRYPDTATESDIDALDAAMEQLGVDAWATIPDAMKIEFVADGGAKTGADTYERFAIWADRQLSKLILGQTLTTEEGPKGAVALGVVHNDVRGDLRDSDAFELDETLTRDLLGPIVRFNWGNAPVPRWESDIRPAPDIAALAAAQKARGEVFTIARSLGIPVAVKQVREELGIREPELGEAVLPPAAPAPALRAPRPDRMTRGETVEPIGAFVTALGEYKVAVARAWAALIDQLRREVGTVTSRGELEARLPRLLARLDLDHYTDDLAEATLTAEALGILQTRARDRAPVTLPSSSPIADLPGWAAALGVEPTRWGARVVVHRARARDAVRYAVLRTAQELVASLVEAPPGKAAEHAAASLDGARDDAQRTEAVVEAGANGAWGDGRWQGLTEGGRAARIYLRYHIQGEPQGDDRVRPTHRAMQGKIYPATHPIWRIWRPPNGFGCRCWVTAHTYDEIVAAGWEITEDYPEVDGEPAVPDKGWQKDRARGESPDAHDLAQFPAAWREALGVKP